MTRLLSPARLLLRSALHGFSLAQATVSQHLKVLEEAVLTRSRYRGPSTGYWVRAETAPPQPFTVSSTGVLDEPGRWTTSAALRQPANRSPRLQTTVPSSESTLGSLHALAMGSHEGSLTRPRAELYHKPQPGHDI